MGVGRGEAMSISVAQRIDRARQFMLQDLWSLDLRPGSFLGFVTRTLQVIMMVGQGFVKDQLLLRASALTYVTALSVIPLLAVALSIVRLFDPNNRLAATAVEYIAAGSPEAQSIMLELIVGANIVGLGSLGAAVLFVSTIFALRHLETTLNSIWGVRKHRGIARRFADYLAVIIVVPLFTGVAMSLGASLGSDPMLARLFEVPGFPLLYEMGLKHAPELFLLIGFSFIYWFFPNTQVKAVSALLGGGLAAVLFSVAQQSYVGMSIGAAKSSALYGGFAALPLLFVWLYVCWAIVLLGAEFSFAHQNRDYYRLEVQSQSMCPAEVETLGFHLAVEVARCFRDRREEALAPGAEELANGVGASVRAVREILDKLEDKGILSLCSVGGKDEGYRLGRPAERIQISELVVALRGDRAEIEDELRTPVNKVVDEMIVELDRATRSFSNRSTLADVLAKIPEEVAPDARLNPA